MNAGGARSRLDTTLRENPVEIVLENPDHTSTSSAEEPKGDLAKLQGTWTARMGSPPQVSDMKVTVKGKTYRELRAHWKH